jgi:proton-dependent oligopeptide transporter, POT family
MSESKQQGHPKGLWVLFGTEMWERFNFYGMRTILSLFLAQALAYGDEQSSIIYGGFLGLCYLTPMLGGYISDKYLGNRNCILLGGFLMAIGQFLLFYSALSFGSNLAMSKTVTWIALGVIVFGNGFFKPNISSMVGSLYPQEQKSKLDSAFTIFYMGINIGALLGQTLCPIVGDVKVNGVRDLTAFKWGFLCAGIAMLLACIIFYFLKDKYVVTPDGKPIGQKPAKAVDGDGEPQAKFTSRAIAISVVVLIGLVALFHFVMGQNWIYAFIYGSGLTLAGLILTDKSLTKVESDRIWVLYIVAFFVIFFWAAFEQAGSSLTFIADQQTDTRILGWEMPASMVQNFNGFFVIIFAIPLSILWLRLQKKGKEPISPVKQAMGLALIAIGYFIIAYQVKGLGAAKLGVIWLIVLYLLHTLGELCLSPIGLSLVAKLAPKRFASLLMGVWFLSNASGYALAGTLGAILPPTTDKIQKADKEGIKLESLLDGNSTATGKQLYFLAKEKLCKVSIDKDKAKAANIDFKKMAEDKIEPTQEQLDAIEKNQIIKPAWPSFAGVKIKNLFTFFMVFVVLTGVAAIVLYSISPLLKKMMHGVR